MHTHVAIITPSFIDRLLDNNPELTQEATHARFQTVSELKQSVARDLEALLNSRREVLTDISAEFAEASHSLLTYGLPDFTSLSFRNPTDHARIQRAIEQTICNFEPRLKRVRVILESPGEHIHALHFRVDALLHFEPAREEVRFDAVLQLNTRRYEVKGGD